MSGIDLIRPKHLEVDAETITDRYAKFYCEPLERGFGITLGNALRRVLLSSIPGAAITSVRIRGVLHEFSTIPGVREDVTEIVLNLKEVRVKLLTEGPEVLRVEARGQREVRAGDIICPSGVVVLNPEHHLATLSPEGELEMEMAVQRGRGYVPADQLREEEAPIGQIAIDAIFSPVQKVNYTVTQTRVGRRTDYDRLVLEIWTDVGVSPQEALAYAAKVLQDQLEVFVRFDLELPPLEAPELSLDEWLRRPVEELDLSGRAVSFLKSANIHYVGQLVQKSEEEILQAKNFGPKSLEEIKEALAGLGLSLGMKVEGVSFPEEKSHEA